MTESKDAGRRVDSYFVCATPRTGSSLLLGLLESTGVAGRPQAYFRRPDEPLWADRWRIPRTADGGVNYADFLRAALTEGRGDNGVFGAKLMWGTLEQLIGKLGELYPESADADAELLTRVFGRTRLVFVRRDDVVAQAVSWLRAEQTNRWYVGGNGEISGQGGVAREPSFDAGRIDELIGMIERDNAAWEEWFASAGMRPYVVRYEELRGDMAGVTRDIVAFLQLEMPAGQAIVARHRRQADELNDQWIARYRREAEDRRTV